jgi:uncharacterized integral membrane protein
MCYFSVARNSKEMTMATAKHADRGEGQLRTILIRASVVALTLATAAIHASLGGLLFLMNAAGYAALALGMVVPGPIARVRWLVRLALIGFTLVTIGGWLLFGVRFPLAYLSKAIEAALVGLLALELWQVDGGPLGLARRFRRLVVDLVDLVGSQGARA